VSEKPKTRTELEAAIAQLSTDYGRMRQACADEVEKRQRAEAREKETRVQFDDLKQRLVTAEFENQRMRGYLQRVQEDDVVREELVKVGDPEGECHLVPKRKPTGFAPPVHFPLPAHNMVSDGSMYHDRSRQKPKHWIAY
jgi:Spy/CpxP family protein refolding chaperone